MISVIVPALNEEKYLAYCLESFANQSYGDYEVIVVDGGSSDKTVEVAKEFADKVIIDSKRPVGAARNAGARIARGDVLAFIDADTVACPSWVETIIQSFNHNRLIGVTGPTLPLDGHMFDRLVYKAATHYLQRALVFVNMPHVPGFNCAYDKQAFFRAGGFDESNVLSEDTRLSLKLRKLGVVAFNKRMLAYTSTRRIKKYGYPYMATFYLINCLFTHLTGKSLRHYPAVR